MTARLIICLLLVSVIALFTGPSCRRIKPPYKIEDKPASLPSTQPESAPATQQATTGPAYVMYTVKRGDTLAKIAGEVMGNRANSILILDANPGLDERNLKVGQEIKVPVRKKRPQPPQ